MFVFCCMSVCQHVYSFLKVMGDGEREGERWKSDEENENNKDTFIHKIYLKRNIQTHTHTLTNEMKNWKSF